MKASPRRPTGNRPLSVLRAFFGLSECAKFVASGFLPKAAQIFMPAIDPAGTTAAHDKLIGCPALDDIAAGFTADAVGRDFHGGTVAQIPALTGGINSLPPLGDGRGY